MTTLVFPGQGSQYLGMAKDFHDNFKIAREVFDISEDKTKIDIREIIFKNSSNLLDITNYTQICIFTASMAIFEVFKELFKDTKLFNKINFVLGHSLGEYSALTASKVFSIENCAVLLKTRGKLMEESYPKNKSGMAAVIGLDCKTIENIIKKYSIDIEVANDNAPGQVVISGIINHLVKSEKILKNYGARKIVYLNVSAAFHSKIMKNAEKEMKETLSKINLNDSIFPVISNVSATASKDKLVLFKNLSQQMSNKVRWNESIKLLESYNEQDIIEIGPGKVLTGIIKRISKNFNHYCVNEIKDIELLKNAI